MKGKSAFGILVGMFVLIPIIMVIAKISTGAIYEAPYEDHYDDVVQILNDGITLTDMSNGTKVGKLVNTLCGTIGMEDTYDVHIGMKQKGNMIGREYIVRNTETREIIYDAVIWEGSKPLYTMLAHICTIYNDNSWWNLDTIKTLRIGLMNLSINIYNVIDMIGNGFETMGDIEEIVW